MSWTERARDGVAAGLVAPLVPRIPARLSYGLANSYVDLRHRLQRTRMKEIGLCLDRVIGPDPEGRNHSKVIRDYFRNSVCVKLDALRLAGDGNHLARSVDVRGEEHLKEALSRGKGAILCTGHFGSVRAGAGLLGVLGYPVTLVADWNFTPDSSQKDSLSKMIYWSPIRRHLKRDNIWVNFWDETRGSIAVALQAAEVLKLNEVVMTNIDIGSRRADLSRAIEVDFMGVRSPILPGPVQLSKFTGAPILTVLLRRSGDWSHLTMDISPVEGNGEASLQECFTRLEKAIKENPAQWELWKMSRLVRLRLYPSDLAEEFYRDNYGWWDENLSGI